MSDAKVLPFVQREPPVERPALASEEEPVRIGEIQGVAAAISSREEYEALLNTARTPEERAAWDLALSPHLRFNLKPCQTPECDSGQPALFQPILVVKHNWMGQPLFAPLDVRYCGECAMKVRIADVMSDQVWAGIMAATVVAGELAPDRHLTELKFTKP